MHEESCCSDFLFIYYFFWVCVSNKNFLKKGKYKAKLFIDSSLFVCFVIFEKDVNISLFQINQSFCYNETDNIFLGFVYAASLFNT